jgi:acyl carrier protein
MNKELIAGPAEQLLSIIDQVVLVRQHDGRDLTTNDKLHIILSESMQALALVTTIEDELNINFDDEDIDLDFFLEFDKMVERVGKHLAKKKGGSKVMEPEVMTDAWWERFLKRTDNMTTPQVFKRALPEGEVENLKGLLVSAIRNMYAFKRNDYGFRCYVDGTEKDQAYVLEHFRTFAPMESESLDEWAERALEIRNIALIFNHVEHFSDLITRQLSLYIDALITKTGMPINGLHTTVFIGNYKYTPLGIHQDLPGSNVIHLHLGNANKIMHTWEPDIYRQLTGGKANNHEIDPLLPHASTFVIEKGDVYSMPWSKFHVGSSSGLSAAITIWFDNHASPVLVNKILGHFKRNYFELSDRQFMEPEKDLASFPSAGELSSLIKLDPWQEKMDFRSLFREVAVEQLLMLLSNGGWREHQPFEEAESVIPDGKWLKRVIPFRIFFEEKPDGYLLVFARGEKIVLGRADEFIRIIKAVNANGELSVDELLNPIADETVREACSMLLSLLLKYRAIAIIE